MKKWLIWATHSYHFSFNFGIHTHAPPLYLLLSQNPYPHILPWNLYPHAPNLIMCYTTLWTAFQQYLLHKDFKSSFSFKLGYLGDANLHVPVTSLCQNMDTYPNINITTHLRDSDTRILLLNGVEHTYWTSTFVWHL